MPKDLNITTLLSHDIETQGTLGMMEYPQFSGFVESHGERPATLWKLLSLVSDYANGQNNTKVGRSTPRGQDGLEPFIVMPEIGSSVSEEILIVDGLYRYISHPSKISLYGFGQSKQNVVNELLNDRIETVQNSGS